ncbi:unnamed protein product [Pseudo-nitzschia multistriata]|uniref:Uncharacterized protein n=1 Tax=Pseudo-nitzschia multistriata TaxID=183589 RepID=A0A448ZL95_9STRA|nr:unnamed protein product [Pseudo-nitzschia multistriata]
MDENDDNDVSIPPLRTCGLRSNGKTNSSGKKNRLRREIESLHQEMEVTGYAKGKLGHRQRKVPRDVSKVRTQKRKMLEKIDDNERALLGEEEEPENDNIGDNKSGKKRLRGSRAAAEESVIRGSLIFQTAVGVEDDAVDREEEGEEEEDCDIEIGEEMHTKTRNEKDNKFEDKEQSSKKSQKTPHHRKTPKSSRSGGPSTKKRRKMYRLRNFQSFKMAQKHGDALAAHARGQPGLAIEQLKEVARGAPSAPQVYSSLGMVYEDMLKESRKRHRHEMELSGATSSVESTKQKTEVIQAEESDQGESKEESIPDRFLANQCILATKAYGSHHVAAILCKKDFTLWVRAGDSAIDIADVHDEVMKLPHLSEKLCEYHSMEKRRWQDEALRDFIVADNLKPAGIDVPAKLALMHMQLGNLSEALTILTDLKNRAGYDFHCSYRAWMLYSDLMLRLGHECIQWNKGIQTNENYMFRRWLRKFSKIFDWQERRLQALSLAFEAAAGTENVKIFLDWIRNRIVEKTKCAKEVNSKALSSEISTRNQSEQLNAESSLPGFPEKLKQDSTESIKESKQGAGKNENTEGKTTLHENEKEGFQVTKEKKLMELNHSRELEAFDKTTTEMNLVPGLAAAKERDLARSVLLKSHDAALSKLLKEYAEKQEDYVSNAKGEEEKIIGMNAGPLPISGSIRKVCSIASELMKHLLGLELYDGAKLVGDAVSFYMKQRACRYEVKIEAKKKADEWQRKILDSPFFIDSYDDGNVSNDEIDLPYLSDDETLLNDVEDSPLIESLRKGALTPEIRVLYGLALIGEGGRNFIAAKALEAIDDLEQESEEWFSEDESKRKHMVEPFWVLFRRAMTEELRRTGAYAFIADVLRKTNKEYEWGFHFAPLFRRHLESLKHKGSVDKLLGLRENVTPNMTFKKNQLLKVILEACKFEMYIIDEPLETKYAFNKLPSLSRKKRTDIAQSVLASIVNIIPLAWCIEGNGNLPPICAEIVKVLAKCIGWLSTMVLDELPYSALKKLADQCTTVVSYFCGNSISKFNDTEERDMRVLEESETFPVMSSWQPTELRMLSICTYNFAVACNVSLFSGWESEEFTMKVLRKRQGQLRHFGVHIGDRRLSGCLPDVIEDELNRQWNLLSKIQPSYPKLDFAEKMKSIKQSEWFQSESKTRQETLRHAPIASYAEEDALQVFLAYTAICIHLSRSETDKRLSTRSQQLALSVLVPLSQFCLDETLWDSDIGEAATTLASYEEWQIMAGRAHYQPVGEREGVYQKRIRKSMKREAGKRILYDKKVQEWIEGALSPTSKDFIQIPNTELKMLWAHADCSKETLVGMQSEGAEEQMRIVHKAMNGLRACYTYAAAEKACLNLSVALLEMAAVSDCNDPFSCLQQAALFASQATKSGNSDTQYRQSLPEMTKCSPTEALIIIGRADCLQAVYFPNEAAYLCSFVARVCRLHRDSREVNFKWNDRWKIVGIYAYNVSVMIRITVSNILNQTMQKAFMAAWERDVVEELERGRRDGRSWINALSRNVKDIGLESGLKLDPSRAKNVEKLQGADSVGRLELDEQSGVDLASQRTQMQFLHTNYDSNVQFEPEELKKKVRQLLGTQIDDGDDGKKVKDIVQYSV